MKQPVASPVSTEERDCRKLSPRRRAYEVTMRSLLYLCAGITCALLLFLIGYILYRGLPGLSWEFLTSQESILKKTDGILPAIQNTIYVIIVTLIFILPLGVGSAIYLTEYASNRSWLPPLSLPPRPFPVSPPSFTPWWVCWCSVSSLIWAKPLSPAPSHW